MNNSFQGSVYIMIVMMVFISMFIIYAKAPIKSGVIKNSLKRSPYPSSKIESENPNYYDLRIQRDINEEDIPEDREDYSFLIPRMYIIELYPTRNFEENYTYHGNVRIQIYITKYQHHLVLPINSYELNITDVKLINDRTKEQIDIKGNILNKELELISFILSKRLEIDNTYELYIEFKGLLNYKQLRGLYHTDEKFRERRWLMTSINQLFNTHRIFPCFDDPKFKSIFTLTIICEQNLLVVSGEKESIGLHHTSDLQTVKRHGKSTTKTIVRWYTKYTFKPTIMISTYSIGFVILDMDEIYPSEVKRVPTIELEIFVDMVKTFYEEYLLRKFPFIHLHVFEVSDTSSVSIDAIGLVIYSNKMIRTSSINVQEYVGLKIIRQYFGHYLSPVTFNDLWFFEGICHFLNNKVIKEISEDDEYTNFQTTYFQNAMRLDGEPTSHKITELNYKLIIDDTDYSSLYICKGASLIGMLEQIVGKTLFAKALQDILHKRELSRDIYKYYFNDFYESIRSKHQLNIQEKIQTWVTNDGFPIVTILRSYEEPHIAVFSQKRFIYNEFDIPSLENATNPTWSIPITYTTQHTMDFKTADTKFWLTDKTYQYAELTLKNNEWIIVNIRATGFYRVNYDAENWSKITQYLYDEKLYENIHVRNRAQLVDDVINIADAGLISFNVAFNLLSYLRHETDPLVWQTFLGSFDRIRLMLVHLEVYHKIKLFVNVLSFKFFQKYAVKNHLTGGYTSNAELTAIEVGCKFGNKNCIKMCVDMVSEWRTNTIQGLANPIPIKLRTIVYTTVISYNPLLTGFLKAQYALTTDLNDKEFLIQSFLNTNQVFEIAPFSHIPSGLEHTRYYIMIAKIAMSGYTNMDQVLMHFNVNKYNLDIDKLFKLGVKYVNDRDRKLNVKNVIELYFKDTLKSEKEIMDVIDRNINWMDENVKSIETWLIDNNFSCSK